MTIHEILKRYWGYDSFRPLQEEIINSVLSGNDTLGLLPTGGGKSIIFQVAGLALGSGVTIIVTPLISLMKDQSDNLKRRGIKSVYFHAGMKPAEIRNAWELINAGKTPFIYIAPERLQNERFMLELRQIRVNLIVVDEAHCISQWGYDFRPSYLKISQLRKLKPDIPVLALTATATPKTAQDIMKQLQFKHTNIFVKSFRRNNISFLVRRPASKIREILYILSRTSGSAIVYVRNRKRTKEIAEYLNNNNISSTYYHAGLDFSEKEQKQNSWKNGLTRVMVATNAFGMGIDKSDVRVVMHYDIPPSLEEYYQEAGRAGRDGKPSYAVLLIENDDKRLIHKHLTEAFPDRKIVKNIYEKICIFLNLAIGEGFNIVKEFNIEKFCSIFGFQQQQCRAALHLLEQSGYINFIENIDKRSRIKILLDRDELYNLNISEDSEKVLISLLRLYPGLFSDYIYIRESLIAQNLGIHENDVYKSFLELSRNKIISFIPFSGLPVVYFPTSREEKKDLIIPFEIYEERKKNMSVRTESILDYAFRDHDCRTNFMLSYFGENTQTNCKKCDCCREPSSKKFKNEEIKYIERILTFLKSSPSGASLITIGKICRIPDNMLFSALNYLCNEGFIVFREDRYWINE